MNERDIEHQLEAWQGKCSWREVMNWFVEKDHFKVGLNNGGSAIKIMHDLGFRNPSGSRIVEAMGKAHFRACLSVAQKLLQKDGFLMRSKKISNGTPMIYFIIDNLSEERTDHHYRLKKRAETSVQGFRLDKFDVLQLMDKLKDEKKKEVFRIAYSSRLNLDTSLIGAQNQKKLPKASRSK